MNIDSLQEFHVTFGQQYRHEKHPRFPDAHPDGYVVIMAPDYEKAREMAFQYLGEFWAFIYEAKKHDTRPYPRGSLARLYPTAVISPAAPGNFKSAGFTLVEIMIIIVICGLIAAMTIPAFQTVRAEQIRNNVREGKHVTQAQRDKLRAYDKARGRTTDFTTERQLVEVGPPELLYGQKVIIEGVEYHISRGQLTPLQTGPIFVRIYK